MDNLFLFLSLMLVFVLSLVSPGPDFALVLRNSISNQHRSNAMYTALGLGAGITIHVFNSLVGLGILLTTHETLNVVITSAGSLYLIYLGIMSLREKEVTESIVSLRKVKTNMKSFKEGLLTNVLNPKAMFFIFSIITQGQSKSGSIFFSILVGLIIIVVATCWFAFLGNVLTTQRVLGKIQKIQVPIIKFLGVSLISIGSFTIYNLFA